MRHASCKRVSAIDLLHQYIRLLMRAFVSGAFCASWSFLQGAANFRFPPSVPSAQATSNGS